MDIGNKRIYELEIDHIQKNYREKKTILWPPDAKSQLTGKDPDTGKDWGQEDKRATEDETVVWHYWLNGHKFKQTER